MVVQDSQLKYSKEMWRVTIGRKHYCAQTKEILKAGLKNVGITVVEPYVDTRVLKTRTQELTDILRNPSAVLQEKQEALRHLIFLAASGDKEADAIITAVSPARSREAAEITRQLGKTDFMFVTYEELHEFIDNIVLRARLINELGDLFKGL